MNDFSTKKGRFGRCGKGWWALPANNHACRKCGARIGTDCKADSINPKGKIEHAEPFTDMELIKAIADRAVREFLALDVVKAANVEYARSVTAMEVYFVHTKIHCLRLSQLLDAAKVDFLHDVLGIHNHLDLDERKLRDCFVPRYAG